LLLASESAVDPSLSPELRADFDMIAKNVMLEAHLIDDLLDLTRITRGKLVLDSRPVPVRQVLEDAIANVRAEVYEKRLELVFNFGRENPIVQGDPVRLQQVFWNILKNAAKFTPAQGRITLAMRTIVPDGRLLIEITDTGAGMTPDELARIFDAFAQGDHATVGSPHRFGGLGLGLAISRSLIELHAGSIRATSAGLGQGSTFTIELPLARLSAADKPAVLTPAPATRDSRAPMPAGLRILLVEDHSPTRAVMGNLLRARNHHVTSASSLSEGRSFGTTQDFDLLITDIGLPDGDGYDLMAELGKLRGLKGIALTGYGAEQDVARAQAAGFIAHLTKPVSMTVLDAVLDMVVTNGALNGKGKFSG
jgi:CheY-like chemotaxis protein